MNKKTRSTKSEKWRHTCNSVEIAWTNEQKVAVTSYGRNKNHDDEIKKNQEKANNSPSYRCAAINNPKKLGKNSKNQKEIAACEQKKPLARKQIFVQTPFSHSTLKLQLKKITTQNCSIFAPLRVSAWPKSPLQFDFKNHENVWTDLKKKTAPQYNSNYLNCKKGEHLNNSRLRGWRRLLIKTGGHW